jgi:DeoR/GlpR family transcriptional regulator of sugar metabolism
VFITTYSSQISILPAERRRRILEYIQINQSGKIEDLAVALGVSEATVRRDLTILATEGSISRTHGGAVLITSTAYELRYSEKKLLFQSKKRLIGVKAAEMVANGETLILDSGSTTFEIARQLTKHKNLTIITYDLAIASRIAFDSSTTVMVTGGIRREGFNVLIGPVAENFLRQVTVNKSFLSIDAIDFKQGITNATFAEVSIKQQIIKAGREVILVADHSKFGNVALAKVCSVEQINYVITDSGIDESIVQGFQQYNIPMIIV